MEFDRMFMTVQGVLSSFQKSTGVKLSDITEDYPEELERIVEIVQNTIKENNWNKDSQRKIHLFLILNTDFENVRLLEEDVNFCHLIGIVPELSSFLYVQFVTRLGWHDFVGEVVLHCPEALVRDILLAFERSMKHIQSEAAVPFFYTVYDALFHKITLLQDVCKHRTLEFVKLFKALAKFKFKEVVASLGCSSDESKYYLGFVYRMYIKLVESCIGWLQNKTLVKEEIYAFNIFYDYTVWPESSMTNWSYNCLGVVASAAVDVSEDVDIDTYIAWNDVNVPEDPTKTLQLSVREAAYNARIAIASMPSLRMSVSGLTELDARLEKIAIRPTSEDDEIASADLDSLISNFKNPKKNQIKWLNALIERNVFDNEGVLNAIKSGHKIATVDTTLQLLNRAGLFLKENPHKSSETIKEICQIYVQSLSRHDQNFLLKKYFERGYDGKPFESVSFDRKIVAFFNNVTREDASDDKIKGEFTWMVIENCDSLLKACISGCLESKKKAELIVNLLAEIRPVTTVLSASSKTPLILTHLLNQMDPSQSDGRFPHLVDLLCKNKLFDGQQSLLSDVLPKLTESISAGNLNEVTYYMDVLIVTDQYIPVQSALYVAFLAKSLNRLRPRIDSFSLDSCEATTRCINLLKATVERFVTRKESEDEEITWLRCLGERLSPLTRIYLDPLWKHWGKDPLKTDSDEKAWYKRGFGYGLELHNLDHDKRASLVTYLVKCGDGCDGNKYCGLMAYLATLKSVYIHLKKFERSSLWHECEINPQEWTDSVLSCLYMLASADPSGRRGVRTKLRDPLTRAEACVWSLIESCGSRLPHIRSPFKAPPTTPVLTASEWQNVAGGHREINDPLLSHSVFTILADCILVLFQVPFNASDGKLARSPGIKTCLAYSLSNFLSLVKFACLKHLSKWTADQISTGKDKLDQILATLPDGVNSEDLLESVRLHFAPSSVRPDC